MSDQNVVVVESLDKRFGSRQVLFDLGIEIGRQEFVAILGRSGGGKSTFLRILEGLDTSYSGTVLVPDSRAVVFQEPRLLPWKKVWQNVAVGLHGQRERDARGAAIDILTEVGLAHVVDAWPLTLSGGEAQRAGLARALVRKPELVLLDEPFAALDALTRIRMHQLLRELVDHYLPSVVIVTHDVNEALALADRVLVLDEGRFVLDRDVRDLRADEADPERHYAHRIAILEALGVEQELAL